MNSRIDTRPDQPSFISMRIHSVRQLSTLTNISLCSPVRQQAPAESFCWRNWAARARHHFWIWIQFSLALVSALLKRQTWQTPGWFAGHGGGKVVSRFSQVAP
jgi:hypothetical protein